MNEETCKLKKRKYNILFISSKSNYYVDNYASFNRLYCNLIYFHNHCGFNVVVLQPNSNKKNENLELKKDIKTYYFKDINILKLSLFTLIDFNLLFVFKVRKIIKKHHVDLIHVDFPYGINCLKFITRVPISYNSHNVEYVYTSQIGKFHDKLPHFLRLLYPKFVFLIEKYALKSVKSVIAVSSFDKKKFIEIYDIPKEKVIVIASGYSIKIYLNPKDKVKAREKLNIEKDKFIVIFHGAEFHNYANREAVNVIKGKITPKIEDNDILFLIAGKMPPFKNKRNLRFVGFVDDLSDFIYSADIAIAPIFRGSGVNVKIIDYLSGKIPVITTKKGVEGLIFKDGVHGYVVKNSVKEMVEKIKELKNNPDKIREFRMNINEMISNHYQWENQLIKVAEKYKSIIESFRTS